MLTRSFKGSIDNVKIYNYARSAADITEEYLKFPQKILHYDFSSINDGKVTDLSGNGNDGSVNGAIIENGVATFDGSNDYIDAGNDGSLKVSDGLTVMSWVKGPLQQNSVIASRYDYGNVNQRSWSLGSAHVANKWDKLRAIISDDGEWSGNNKGKLYRSTDIAFDNTWHHVAMTFDSGTFKLFVDGSEQVPDIHTDLDVDHLFHSNVGVSLGRSLKNGIGKLFFDGQMDEVKIYNYALGAEQINSQKGFPSQLILHYDFSSINDGKVTDLSGNGNDGSVNGAIIENGVATFDGSNDYIDAGNDGSLKVSDGLTVMSWVKGPLQQNSVIASRYDYGNVNQRSWSLGSAHVANKWDKLRAIISDDGEWSGNNKGKLYRSTDIAFDNTWHHVAMTFDSGTFKLFVDGSEQVPDIHTDLDVDHLFHSNVGVSLGRSLKNGIGKLFFDGQMDEVKIYNYALTPQKVLEKFEEISSPENGMCNDQLDNDGDGLVDCADPDCEGEKNVLNGQCCQDSISCTENIGITGFCYNYVCVDGEPIGGTYIPPIDNFPGGYICSWGGDLNHIDDHTFCPGGAQCGLDINVQLALADVDGDGNNDLHNFYFCNIVDLDGDGVNDDVDVCDENKPEKPVYLPPNQNAGCQLADINADNLVEGVDIDQFIELYNQRDQINADLNSVAASPIHFTENNQIHGGDIDMFIEHYNNR